MGGCINTKSDSRTLHTKDTGIRRENEEAEVILANNTGLFVTHWALTNHPLKDHPRVILARKPFWIDKSISEHDILEWGQCLLGLPSHIRGIVKRLFPNYPEDKPLTWGMVKAAREFVSEELKKMSMVEFHDLSSYELNDLYLNNFNIIKKDEYNFQYKETRLFNFPLNMYLYNLVRTARVFNFEGVKFKAHTDLYTMSPDKIPKDILVYGTGLSTRWINIHFQKSRVYAIAQNVGDKVDEIPGNKEIPGKEITVVNLKDIYTDKKNKSFVIRLDNKDSSLIKHKHIPEDNLYIAAGYEPNTIISNEIPNDHKLEMTNLRSRKDWVAPGNLPIGSSTQSLLKTFDDTGNSHLTFEVLYGHRNTKGFTYLVKAIQNRGIRLNKMFSILLDEEICSLPNPLNSEQELILLKNIFEKSRTDKIDKAEMNKFEEAIISIQNEIQRRG